MSYQAYAITIRPRGITNEQICRVDHLRSGQQPARRPLGDAAVAGGTHRIDVRLSEMVRPMLPPRPLLFCALAHAARHENIRSPAPRIERVFTTLCLRQGPAGGVPE